MDRCPDLAGHLESVQVRCSTAGSGEADALDCPALLAELRALADCIACARHDLTALGAADIVGYHVPAATDELNAIVAHTAAATFAILDQCDRIEEATTGTSARPAAAAAAARIFEACSFQDITGQRVAKVVRTLRIVDERVQSILLIFAPEAVPNGRLVASEPLLSGPQFPLHAMDQNAVDTLLAATS